VRPMRKRRPLNRSDRATPIRTGGDVYPFSPSGRRSGPAGLPALRRPEAHPVPAGSARLVSHSSRMIGSQTKSLLERIGIGKASTETGLRRPNMPCQVGPTSCRRLQPSGGRTGRACERARRAALAAVFVGRGGANSGSVSPGTGAASKRGQSWCRGGCAGVSRFSVRPAVLPRPLLETPQRPRAGQRQQWLAQNFRNATWRRNPFFRRVCGIVSRCRSVAPILHDRHFAPMMPRPATKAYGLVLLFAHAEIRPPNSSPCSQTAARMW